MLLVADVGNTHTVLGLYQGEELQFKWNVQTTKERTSDEWGLTFRSFFELAGLHLNDVSGFVMCSVVPPAVHSLKHGARTYLKTEPLIVGPGVKTGLSIRYDNPKEVGADRVVNAVAGRERFPGASIIVDFGTATTFDCLSSKGEYLGGIICPGIGIALDALVTRAAKLPKVEIARPPSVIGKTTEQAMQSGILFGYAAMVDGLVARLEKEMEPDVKTIATGGLSAVIAKEARSLMYHEPNLTLDGLRLIYEKNR
ncbi:MAG: type III pantothenate kinase [Deltaproteobacteria bacterium]|nr:type III pantothenate kinase [Deltaproteobacteria bacterium]MBN2674392.1 type III pantothenate kinase [Deltaproteobacteria bacterium]